MLHKNGLPEGVIAIWGKVVLEPLDAERLSQLARGETLKKGFSVDYLNDFSLSAKSDLPVYRLGGSAG